MFSRIKGKPNLQELQQEFDFEQMRLGNIEFQMEELKKAKGTCVQRLTQLAKQGRETKKKIAEEVTKKAGEQKQNEVN